MSTLQINRMILEKIEARDIPPHIKGFIRDILQHEKGNLNQESPSPVRYSRAYENLLNKYIRQNDADDLE